jgi:glycosyltransferase involved in cell wall biosynthesis
LLKIVFITSLYPPLIRGGAEISVMTLAEGMAAKGHQVYVVTTNINKGRFDEVQGGVHVIRLEIKNLRSIDINKRLSILYRFSWHLNDRDNARMGKIVRQLLYDIKPEVISCHTLSGFSISAWKAACQVDVPLIQVLHDYYLLCPKVTMFRHEKVCENICFGCRMFRLGHKELSNQVTAVVGISTFILQRHLEFGFFKKTPIKKVIYNARVSPNQVILKPEPIRPPRVFGFLGSLSSNKGIEVLLEAFLSLKRDDIRLLVAGTGDCAYESYLRNRFDASRVEFIGYTKREDFFKKVDVTMVPSIWYEPLGMVIPESLHAGIPVIATKQGGIPEMILDGVNGILINAGSKKEIKDAILRLAGDHGLYAKLSFNARNTSKIFFDINRLTSEYEQVYRDSITF